MEELGAGKSSLLAYELISASRARGRALSSTTAERRLSSISRYHELVKYADRCHRLVTLLIVKQQ